MSTLSTTVDAVELFRLASLKKQLQLEGVGLRSSGGAIRPRLAKEFGMSLRAPREAYVAAIQARMDALMEKLHIQQLCLKTADYKTVRAYHAARGEVL